ncbi:amidohydrolase family protein [Nitratireductor sp. ZSWI3]|uniref:metal-dependent hydrolase family protein n=1 Tax=Nitratireductor sp. ZSWI3 TaxID=2966359 RepID=UPI00214FFA4B|nr:amidohydrolase family protein [Nitratireductor sp. ZSWI3]MCR4265564.1 amidohydrolase family protein [Nitratireductor sp. ZSWI3]
MTYIFRNARIFDGKTESYLQGLSVVVEENRISDMGEAPVAPAEAVVIDCGGRVLMPGLIDAHVHIVANSVDLSYGKDHASYVSVHAYRIAKGWLDRGFTTVRDAGGADRGHVRAIEEGVVPGPRMVISGMALSQTGGHGDMRPRTLAPGETAGLIGSQIGRIADGVAQVREAARDELRKGAHLIKVMASGGAASVSDPIEVTQYSIAELRAIVEEAEAFNTYVMAHAYNPRSIKAAVAAGVRTIEHGNLIDRETAELMRDKGAWLVPTLVASSILTQFADRYGFTAESMRKISQVCELGLQSVRIARQAGTPIGFGTDLLGSELHDHQCDEFTLRAQVERPVDTLISATSANAEMMMMGGRIGVIAPGALADILVVDGDPLADPATFTQQGRNIPLIMKDGKLYRDRLTQ